MHELRLWQPDDEPRRGGAHPGGLGLAIRATLSTGCRWILACAGGALLLAACGDGGTNPVTHEPAPFPKADAIAGVNLDVSRRLDDSVLDALVATGVDWIALVPFGWQPRFDTPEVRLRTTNARWGETDAGLSEIIARARERGIRTLIKPHIWLLEEVPGQWRGTIGFDTGAHWQAWEADYRAFIMHYATLAQSQGAHMLSVGVELHRAVSERPDFWRSLIDDVRQAYDGPLTYGANWDGEMAAVRFWDRLDYLGVHAYFPLTNRQDASVADLERGWRTHLRTIESLCATWDRPILFTEVGYRSIAGAAVQPWNFRVRSAVDAQEQADAYEALFRTFWERDWFAGLFLWEWDADISATADLSDDDDYTPQTKPAQAVMARWFGGGEG